MDITYACCNCGWTTISSFLLRHDNTTHSRPRTHARTHAHTYGSDILQGLVPIADRDPCDWPLRRTVISTLATWHSENEALKFGEAGFVYCVWPIAAWPGWYLYRSGQRNHDCQYRSKNSLTFGHYLWHDERGRLVMTVTLYTDWVWCILTDAYSL